MLLYAGPDIRWAVEAQIPELACGTAFSRSKLGDLSPVVLITFPNTGDPNAGEQ